MLRWSSVMLSFLLVVGGSCSSKAHLTVGSGGAKGQGGESGGGAGGSSGSGGSGLASEGGTTGMTGNGGSDGSGGATGNGGVPGIGGATGVGGVFGRGGADGKGGTTGGGGSSSHGGSAAGGNFGSVGGSVGAGGSPSSCECPTGQVYRHHACLSTFDLGCGPSCTSTADCKLHETCEDCAASSSCISDNCLRACAPTELNMDPLAPDSLRITPTVAAPAGGSRITIQGHAWYIGASMYFLRVGTVDVMPSGDSRCNFDLTAPANPPGKVPVWVSQYASRTSWVLAGFLNYGGAPDSCIQPGYPCASSQECCGTADARVACTTGRCRAM